LNPKSSRVLTLAQTFIRKKEDIIGAHLFVLAQRISSLGYDVEVLAPHDDDLRLRERIENLTIHRFRYGLKRHQRLAYRGNMHQLVKKSLSNKLILACFLLSFLWKALKLVRKPEIKLIHAHWWIPSGLVGALVSCISGKPLLVTTHGTDIMILKTSAILRILAGFVFRRAAHITLVSSFLKRTLLSILDIPAGKITVLPMPINPDTCTLPEVEERKKRKIILCVARYTKQKRLDILIEALTLLRQEVADFEAVLIGEGKEEENLKRMATEKGLSEQIAFLPLMSQQELSHYYLQSDVLVLPSEDEGFGLVLVEAQLFHTPVIGANSGGIPEIIQSEKTGLLFPPGEAPALARQLKRILTDENLARKLASNAHRNACTEFSPEKIARGFIRIYQNLVQKEN
jgi:glycosyltransferase involved in cell wall biosynthesis